jgi:hypothetical protein
MRQSPVATFSFVEAIDRIAHASDLEELKLLAEILIEEKKEYPLFYIEVIAEALRVKRKYLCAPFRNM